MIEKSYVTFAPNFNKSISFLVTSISSDHYLKTISFLCNPGFGFYKHPCAMYDTKNLLLNHLIEASGLRAEFGSYSINGHLSGTEPKDLIS